MTTLGGLLSIKALCWATKPSIGLE